MLLFVFSILLDVITILGNYDFNDCKYRIAIKAGWNYSVSINIVSDTLELKTYSDYEVGIFDKSMS